MRTVLKFVICTFLFLQLFAAAYANTSATGPIYKFDGGMLNAKTPIVWSGKFQTTFGEIRVSQIGSMASGDYAKVGKLQGSVSPDGNTWRGIFYRYDGRWGVFEFKRTARGFTGRWEFDRPPFAVKSKKWNGTFRGKTVSIRNSIIEPENVRRNIYPTPKGEIAEYLSFRYHRQKPPVPKPGPRVSTLKQGQWYGGYDTVGAGPSINLEVDHLSGTLLVDASISFYSVAGNGCPENFHRKLCRDLNRATANSGNGAGGQAQILGEMAERDELFIAFGLPGDPANRLLALRYSGTRSNPNYLARIYHETRGLEYEGIMKGRPHLCEQTRCQGGRLDALDKKGTNALGVLSNLSRYLANFDRNRDERASSHRRVGPTPRPPKPPKPQTPVYNMADRLHGTWELIDEAGRNLGRVNINAIGRSITGSGRLEENLLYGREVEVALEEVSLTDEAIRFELTYFAGESGEQNSTVLLLTLPKRIGGSMKGSLRSSQRFELITMNPVDQSSNSDFDEPEEYDLPGVGVTGPSYGLINVPNGKNLKLRSGPGKNYNRIGNLSWNASDVLVMQCAPEIDSLRFEQSNQAGKRRLLQGSWCQVQHGQGTAYVEGYIPGKYLNPRTN